MCTHAWLLQRLRVQRAQRATRASDERATPASDERATRVSDTSQRRQRATPASDDRATQASNTYQSAERHKRATSSERRTNDERATGASALPEPCTPCLSDACEHGTSGTSHQPRTQEGPDTFAMHHSESSARAVQTKHNKSVGWCHALGDVGHRAATSSSDRARLV